MKNISGRPNRTFHSRSKPVLFSYEDLLAQAEARIAGMEALYAHSRLPLEPDEEKINRILVEVRKAYYQDL